MTAMIILAVMVSAKVKWVFIDQGNSTDIIFWNTFDKLRLKNFDLQCYKEKLIGFASEKVHPDRYVMLHLTLGTRPQTLTIKVDFLVVDYPSTYNVSLGDQC